MVNLSVGIFGHSSRWTKFGVPLLERVQGEADLFGIPVDMYIDSDNRGVWWNFRRAFLDRKSETHRLLLQEDVIVCRDFLAAVLKGIDAHPETIIKPFFSGTAALTAARQGVHWIPASVHGQVVIYPEFVLDNLIEWAETPGVLREDSWGVHPVTGEKFLHDDYVVRQFCQATGVTHLAMIPSLAQHVGTEDSVLGHNCNNWQEQHLNTARTFIGENRSGLDTDWRA